MRDFWTKWDFNESDPGGALYPMSVEDNLSKNLVQRNLMDPDDITGFP